MEKNKPCRYYEEQGFCVYGETCQYSHGTNPVVLDGVNAGLILTSTVSTTAITGSTNTISTATNHQSTSRNSSVSSNDETNHQGSNSASNSNNLHKRLGGTKKRERNSGPGRNSGAGGVGAEGHHNRHHHHHNNNNNASNNNNNHHHHNNNNHHHQQHPNNHNNKNGGSGANNRHSGPSNSSNSHRHSNNNNGAGNSGHNYSHQNNNSKTIDKCTLEVRRVPQHQNTIKDMNEHFSKFGTIVNLQVNYEGDPEGALIQYSSPHEAIAAYRSPEAVFNNRFIRVHWHFKTSLDLANHQGSDHSTGNQQDNSKRFRRDSGTHDDEEEEEKDEDIKEGRTNNRGDKSTKVKQYHNQISKQYKGQQTALNRIGKKRSIMMRLGLKAPSSKFSNNQAKDQDEDALASDEPPVKVAHLDPDRAENNQASPASGHLRPSIKSRRELGMQNIKQQQDLIDANSNKKKVQKQGVEIQRKQSDLLTNLIHQQKILIKKIESSTEKKERDHLKSILDELTQKTKDLMTKTSLKQNMIISKQQAATTSTTKTSSDDPPSTSAAISLSDHNANATTVDYKEGVENDDEEEEQEEDQNTLEQDKKDQKVNRLDQRELTISEVDGASN